VEPSFNIRTENADPAPLQILVEAGPQGLALVATDMDSPTVRHCAAWHFAAGMGPGAAAEALAELFAQEPLLQQVYQKAELLYSFPETVLTPQTVYPSVDAHAMIQQVYGDAQDGIVRTDFVLGHHLHLVYRLPMAAARLTLQGNTVATGHQYAALLNSFSGSGDALWAVFYPHHVTVLLRKAGGLQIVQQFAYTLPEDAAWYLLAVCEQFGVPVQDVPLTLYGMIDQRSSLYTELYKYFLHISFAENPAGLSWPDTLPQQQGHFFSHLFTALLCE
jgi:Protein of unknown function (DUF3822)